MRRNYKDELRLALITLQTIEKIIMEEDDQARAISDILRWATQTLVRIDMPE